MIRYTADTHFGHYNIIEHDNRPFTSVEEMDNFIINAWNNSVSNTDDIYILGDLCYKSKIKPYEYLEKLKGNLHFIIGNHDNAVLKDKRALDRFVSVDKLLHIEDNGKHIILCHYPMIEWDGYFRDWYHIYAHVHNNLNRAYNIMKHEKRALNAGCMINNYIPVTFKQLQENNRKFIRSIEGNGKQG